MQNVMKTVPLYSREFVQDFPLLVTKSKVITNTSGRQQLVTEEVVENVSGWIIKHRNGNEHFIRAGDTKETFTANLVQQKYHGEIPQIVISEISKNSDEEVDSELLTLRETLFKQIKSNRKDD